MVASGSADVQAMVGISNTIAAYCQALDDGRTDDAVATFCPDGTMAIPGADVLVGHEAIREAYAAMKPRRPQRHVVVNTFVTSVDGQTATATSDLLVMGKGEAGWSVFLVGRYNDALRQTDSGWLFQARTLEFI
jgi:ketosteroid isomerase-like protein